LLDDALLQHRRLGNIHDAAATLRMLAHLALNEQRLDEASAQSTESLGIFRALHDPNCAARSARIHAQVLCAAGDPAGALGHAQSAAATFREHVSRVELAGALHIVGCIHAEFGDRQAARRALLDAIDAQGGMAFDRGLSRLLEAIAGMHPEAPVAPALLGSASAMREHWKLSMLPAERTEHDRCHAAVRAAYDGGNFERALSTGRALTRDEAIQNARALLRDVDSG
jgi:hypothetical protein